MRASSLSLSAHTGRGKTMWAHWWEGSHLQTLKGSPQQKLNLPAPWPWTSQPPEPREVKVYCLSQPDYGILLTAAWVTKTLPCETLIRLGIGHCPSSLLLVPKGSLAHSGCLWMYTIFCLHFELHHRTEWSYSENTVRILVLLLIFFF